MSPGLPVRAVRGAMLASMLVLLGACAELAVVGASEAPASRATAAAASADPTPAPTRPLPSTASAAAGADAAAAASAAIGAAGAVSAGSAVRGSEGPPDIDAAPRRASVDPFEPFNRGVHSFNMVLDAAVFRPVARAYDRFTPEVVRLIARNVLSNLLDPYIAINNFLQGKPAAGFSDLGRFAFNSTFGFFGFGDPASEIGLQKHREDFGQTMGVWGVPAGPFLVLPFFGPSNVRDGVGFGVDAYAALINRFDNVPVRNSLGGLQFVETRAYLLPADRLLLDALDPYLLVRDTYLQRRRNLIFDGNPPDDEMGEE